jgi:hypothetical protein
MTPLHDDLLAALDAVEVASPNRYVLLGEARDILDEAAKQPLSHDDPDRLAAALAADLYQRLYIRPSPLTPPPQADLLSSRDLIAALSRANTGTGTWEPGWILRRIEGDGAVVVARDGVDYWADASYVRPRRGSLREGESCRVRMPKELRELVWGFYMAVGDGADESRDAEVEPQAIDRYYWHLSLSAAVPFLAAATSRLNAARMPFRLKVPNEPRAYRRADAGVLYVRRCDRHRIGAIVADIHSSTAHALGEEVPLFTRRLATGLGFAEDPGGELSFGHHRCRIIARALWRSFLRGDGDREARAKALASAFLEEGLDPARPHLGPSPWEAGDWGSEPLNVARPRVDPVDLTDRGAAATSPAILMLEAATRIGEVLCESAYWDRDGRECNWMGRSNSEFTASDGPIDPTSAALGPDWYDGSAGIAAFLSQLSSSTGNAEFRRTARGAIANAIRQCGRPRAIRGSSPLSFFCGDLGVAFAAWMIGNLGDCYEFGAEIDTILARVAESLGQPHLLELIGGSAGAIPALIAMSRSPDLKTCLDLAITLGEELGRTVIRRDSTCAWDPEAASGAGISTLPLTGLSHGAAGIGLALLELYAASGRADFLELARGAVAYEDTHFDPRAGNWVDLRHSAANPPFCLAWCHGAPGIALSRLRAATLDPGRGEAYLAVARTAMATTVAAIEEKLALSRCDATPCNGITGLIEITSIAHGMLAESSYHDVAMDAAHLLIARHSTSGDWPSGAPSGGPNPSLMLGTAGIGYTFLRLHDPERVPSVLWIAC